MPASSADGLGNVVAALESNFKQQQRRLINSETFVSDNSTSADKEDESVTDSWIDQILGNEIFYNESTDYTSQNGKPFGKCFIPGLHHLKKEITMACEKNLTSGIIKKCDKQAMAGPKLASGSQTKKEDQLEEPRRILYNKEKIQLGWINPPLHRSGMFNLGNTCYLNSSLQALFHIPAFANWLMEESLSHLHRCSQNAMNASFCSLCAMIKTHKVATESNQGAIRPHLIVNKLKCIGKMFTNGRQEDAHEFLKLLLDHMERSYLQYRGATKLDHLSRQTTPLNQIFGGYLRQQVSCPSCHYVSTTFSHFQDLVLDIRASSSLDQALEHYFRTETLDAANCYKCERCKKKVPATKRSLIERPPNVLLIQLKRFTFNGGKIGKHINIQRFLNLSRFVNGCQRKGNKSNGTMNGGNGIKMNNCNNGSWSNGHVSDDESDGALYKYRLVSMVVHLGGSQHGGHYIACAEGGNGTMYEFDDCSVRNVGIQSVLLRNPYILFYELTKRPSSTPTEMGVKQLNRVGRNDSPHSPVVRQNSDKFLNKPSAGLASSPGLFRQNSDNRLMHPRVSGLSNGSSSKEDLGEVIRTGPSAPLQQKHALSGMPLTKDRERITFDLKSPNSIKSISLTNGVRSKIIMRTNVSLLNSSPASPSMSSTNTSSAATTPSTAKVIHSTTTNAISISKLSSIAYVLDQKKAEQMQPSTSNGNSFSNKGSSAKRLVPYLPSDTESSGDDEGSSPIMSLGNDSSKSNSNGSVLINGYSINGATTNTISNANSKAIRPFTQFKPRQIIVNKNNNMNGVAKSHGEFKEPTSISIISKTELRKTSPGQAGPSNSDLVVNGNDFGAAGGSSSPQKEFISCNFEGKNILDGDNIQTTTIIKSEWKVNKRKTELAKSVSEDSGVKTVGTYGGINNNAAKIDGSCDSRSLQSCQSSNLSEKTVAAKVSSKKGLLSFISCLTGAVSPATTPDGDDKKELLRNVDVSITNGKTKSLKKLKSQVPKAPDGPAAPEAEEDAGVLSKRSREEEKEHQQRKETISKKCRSEKFFRNMVNGKLCSNGTEGTSSDNSPVINGKCNGSNAGAASRTVSREGLNGSCGGDASDDGINSIKNGNFSRDECGKKHKTKNITNGHCGMANGDEDSSNDSDDHNINHSFNNGSLNGDSNRNKMNGQYNPDHRNGNKRTNSDDDSDSRDEDSSVDKPVMKAAPVTTKVAYDKHTRGDLQYTLSSHKKQRLQLNGYAEGEAGHQQKGGKVLIWSSEDVAPGTDAAHQLQHSTSFAFGRQGGHSWAARAP